MKLSFKSFTGAFLRLSADQSNRSCMMAPQFNHVNCIRPFVLSDYIFRNITTHSQSQKAQIIHQSTETFRSETYLHILCHIACNLTYLFHVFIYVMHFQYSHHLHTLSDCVIIFISSNL